ncbi:MAG: response regulator [Chloroflexota bacterium]
MAKPLALIIEDDHRLGMIFEKALIEAEFETEVVDNGQLALNRLDEITPDVIVLDLHLPKVSGPEILTQIRQNTRLSHTKVMIASADPLMAEKLRGDADLVLIKPVSFTQLRDLAIRLSSAPSHP